MSHLDVGSAAASVPQLVRWSPTRWPTFWCEIAQSGDPLRGDCGVHAALASAVFAAFGVAHARGRAVILPRRGVTDHWRATWDQDEANTAWITSTVVHHEVIRIGERWWDPTEARWFSGPGSQLLSGRVVAVREEGGDWVLES